MKILQVAEALHPSFGGIAEGVFQQGIELQKMGHTVEAMSAETDPVDRLDKIGVAHHKFVPEKEAWRWSKAMRRWCVDNVQRFDVVVLNGLWMGPLFEAGRACRKLQVPYVVMPHGMMDPYFQSTRKKRMVKKLYWAMAEGKSVRRSRGLFFTASAEQEKAESVYPISGVRSWVVGYGIRDPGRKAPLASSSDGAVKLLFMSRVHPKKGLDLVLQALPALPARVTLDVHGDGDDAYSRALRQRAAQLGLESRVRWHGFTTGEAKWAAIEACDAMILASRQENFGVIVAEALSVGRPALISCEVNIWQEVEKDGSGLAAACSVEGVKELVCRYAALDAEERTAMSERARAAFARRYRIETSAAAFAAALSEAASS